MLCFHVDHNYPFLVWDKPPTIRTQQNYIRASINRFSVTPPNLDSLN